MLPPSTNTVQVRTLRARNFSPRSIQATLGPFSGGELRSRTTFSLEGGVPNSTKASRAGPVATLSQHTHPAAHAAPRLKATISQISEPERRHAASPTFAQVGPGEGFFVGPRRVESWGPRAHMFDMNLPSPGKDPWVSLAPLPSDFSTGYSVYRLEFVSRCRACRLLNDRGPIMWDPHYA
ncbi:hypothetical protein MKZ38_005678 [Zalerion maritima]|uniref:Uncharacterized protein n=1 Tax=Zalerion maritima TaxID=339359 RepID=A0AAD5WNV3_9PEZI|nr:hypothetical protein MKZ38_005678 [Zalerion maritima]